MYPPLHFLPLTGYWYPENFLLASAYYYWSIFRVKIFQKAMSLRFSLFSFTSNHFVWRKPKNGVRKWKVKNCTSITTSIFVTDLGRGFATRSHNTSLTSKFSGIFEGQTWAPRSHGIKCHTFATLSQTGVTFCNWWKSYVTTDNPCQLHWKSDFLVSLVQTLCRFFVFQSVENFCLRVKYCDGKKAM